MILSAEVLSHFLGGMTLLLGVHHELWKDSVYERLLSIWGEDLAVERHV